ncbi:hypothetical protein JCM10213v2_001388 [Rhodosporidiobolus nylandii]
MLSPRESVRSPGGNASVSSVDSAGSRAGPDLAGSNARYFPIRSVMYPSAASTSSSTGSSSVPAYIERSQSVRSSGTAQSTLSKKSGQSARAPPVAGPASRAEAPVGGAGANESSRHEAASGAVASAEDEQQAFERAAAGLGVTPASRSAGSASSGSRRSRPEPERGDSGKTARGRTETDRTSRGAAGSEAEVKSEDKPRSLDDFLEEPTTHAKHGEPGSDDEEREGVDEREGEGEELKAADEAAADAAETGSNVQVHDFVGEEQAAQKEGGNRIAAYGAVSSVTGASDKPLLMTSRFEHQIADDGNILVLTGREGQLERCEDEPIHAPGAIQAFGVLIAFDTEDDGRMVVQQVSENSGFILGLPPRTLFRAKCLSDILDEDEFDVLLDALETLDDRDADLENDESGPYTFNLSGRGIPGSGDADAQSRECSEWTCHAAIHRPSRASKPKRVVLELELVDDIINPLTTVSSEPFTPDERGTYMQPGENGIDPTEQELIESTVSIVRPLRTLARLREKQKRKGRKRQAGLGEMDIMGLLGQINDQLGKADDLETFLKVTAGIFRELTEFDRVMVYQFDEAWNGRVVAEQVDWTRTKDLFRGLNFPASDIPAQARELYRINKVRLLFDRDQPTARLCCRSIDEVDSPLDMTHCHLRAMSPIHIKYLGNMGVRSSMSVSITAFGDLWGLISMHTYGRFGHRISFPVRQLCKLLGQSISRNIERISYATRLQARKLINTSATDENPSGFIVAKAEDLLDLFHADFGILSVGDEAKILGQVSNSQELLAVLEYLRIKQFTDIMATQDIKADFPDVDYPNGFQLIAGLLSVPLSTEGKDFIVFFRRPQLHEVRWAGNPYENKTQGDGASYRPLEPRSSFKTWSEVVLCLVYGKFISVWREKESALAASQLTNLLLQNASHEVRTPLNAIINYLELALDGPIQGEVRDNLQRSHAASKSLIHVINDLLDLTRTERGNELYLTDPFDLRGTLEDSLAIHRDEAAHRGLSLDLVEQPTGTPPTVVGDRAKIRQIVTNVVANAIKHTHDGGILVEWGEVVDQNVEDALQAKQDSIRIGISVTDTGIGMSEEKLENIFRQFEQVSTIGDKARDETADNAHAVGLGLAQVARVVRTLGGQLSMESKTGEASGTKVTVVFPFRLPDASPSSLRNDTISGGTTPREPSEASASRAVSDDARRSPLTRKRSSTSVASKLSSGSGAERRFEINSLVASMSSTNLNSRSTRSQTSQAQSRKAASMSSKSAGSIHSANSTRSAPSFYTANSSLGAGSMASPSTASGSVGSDNRTRPGQVNISGARQPLRPARLPPSSGDEASVAPMASPSQTPRSPASANYFSLATSPAGPISAPSAYDAKPMLRRSSTAAATIASYTPEAANEATSTRLASRSRSQSLAASVDGAATLSQPTPRASSPIPEQPARKSPSHISEYRKAPAAGQEDRIEPMRVLVVEDEKVNRMIISQRLKKDGHEVVVAEHGAAAVRKFEEDRNFDCVLMDLLMPIMGGLDASRNIRRVEKETPLPPVEQRPSSLLNHGIPILAVSASLPERDRRTIVDAGLDGWLLKPIDFKRLKTLMRGAVDQEAREQELYQPGQWERGGWLYKAPSLSSKLSSVAPRRSASSWSAASAQPSESPAP